MSLYLLKVFALRLNIDLNVVVDQKSDYQQSHQAFWDHAFSQFRTFRPKTKNDIPFILLHQNVRTALKQG